MRMRNYLDYLRTLNDDDFKFELPEFNREEEDVKPLRISTADPDAMVAFINAEPNNYRSDKKRNPTMEYLDGTQVKWINSRRSWEFYYMRELIAVATLR